jgi:hypothetical protein
MHDMSLLQWAACAILLVAAWFQFKVYAYQNIAREIGRIALHLHGKRDQFREQVQALHENLIPNDLLLDFIGYRVSSGAAILGFFAVLGWAGGLVAAVCIFVVFPLIFSVTPHLCPKYYQNVLRNIQKYVRANTLQIQQKIDGCSVSVNEINEVIDLGITEKKNLGLWYAQLTSVR